MHKDNQGASASGPGCEASPSAASGVLAESHPSRKKAAEQIGGLINRILKLAPEAGLYIGIKVEPAKATAGDMGSKADV